jgi:hypothetical protein
VSKDNYDRFKLTCLYLCLWYYCIFGTVMSPVLDVELAGTSILYGVAFIVENGAGI